ncbi:MAG: hypothetical protein HYS09_01260 [Chloroflexi bacterium]|nr:hypothetical protein [Chloroflexota bacterium]
MTGGEQREAPPERSGLLRLASQWLLGVLLALSLTAFFLTLNAAQLTARGTGERLLRRAPATPRHAGTSRRSPPRDWWTGGWA